MKAINCVVPLLSTPTGMMVFSGKMPNFDSAEEFDLALLAKTKIYFCVMCGTIQKEKNEHNCLTCGKQRSVWELDSLLNSGMIAIQSVVVKGRHERGKNG